MIFARKEVPVKALIGCFFCINGAKQRSMADEMLSIPFELVYTSVTTPLKIIAFNLEPSKAAVAVLNVTSLFDIFCSFFCNTSAAVVSIA